MRHRLIHALLTLAVVIFSANQPAFGGGTPIGQIDTVEGEVTVQRSDDQKVKGRAGLSLYPGDLVTTGEGGMVLFSFQKERQFRLGEGAQMSVDELSGTEVEDDKISMRLVLGYLWSKIQKIGKKPGGLVLHTPTAVMGIRGTEFDTVVSLDGTSAVAVDEGSVEVEAEDKKIVVDKGRMTEVEADKRPSPPVQAMARERRNWKGWRQKRVKKLLDELPQRAPMFRKRFETAVDRFTKFTERLNESSENLSRAMDKVRQAKRQRNRQKFRKAARHLREQVDRFKKMAAGFRKGMNRVRVMGRTSHQVEKFAARNQERFSSQEFATIESNLAVISRKREALKSVIRPTITTIKETFKALRELRGEIKGARGPA